MDSWTNVKRRQLMAFLLITKDRKVTCPCCCKGSVLQQTEAA